MTEGARTQPAGGESELTLEFQPAGQHPGLPPLEDASVALAEGDPGAALSGWSEKDRGLLREVARWAKHYLTQPHPELGRSGQVCPYMSRSFQEQRFVLTILRSADANRDRARDVMLRLRDHFLAWRRSAPRDAQWNTIVVLMPDIPAPSAGQVVTELHGQLKPAFLSCGLMLGEFFADSSKPGLHNPEFRPLRCNTPLLVIRSMVLTDIAFLTDDAAFIRAFIDHFRGHGRDAILGYLRGRGALLDGERKQALLGELAHFEAAAPVRPSSGAGPSAALS